METAPDAPLILTLELAPEAQAWAQAMRDTHFPPGRDIVPAHVSLFHALPPDREALIRSHLAPPRPAPAVWIEAPYLLGRGVAFRVACPEIAAIRAGLRARLPAERLTRQDRAPWQPHLTVQNKVAPEEARALLGRLVADHALISVIQVVRRASRKLR